MIPGHVKLEISCKITFSRKLYHLPQEQSSFQEVAHNSSQEESGQTRGGPVHSQKSNSAKSALNMAPKRNKCSLT